MPFFDILLVLTSGGAITSSVGILVLFVITIVLTSSFPWMWTVMEWALAIYLIAIFVLFVLSFFFSQDKGEHLSKRQIIVRLFYLVMIACVMLFGMLVFRGIKDTVFTFAFPHTQHKINNVAKNTGASSTSSPRQHNSYPSVTGFKYIIETKKMDYSINGNDNAQTDLQLPVVIDNDKTFILTGGKNQALLVQGKNQAQELLLNKREFEKAYKNSNQRSFFLYDKKNDQLTMHLTKVPYLIHYNVNDPSSIVKITPKGATKLRQIINNPFTKNNSTDVVDRGVDKHVTLQGSDFSNTGGKNYKIDYVFELKLKQIPKN